MGKIITAANVTAIECFKIDPSIVSTYVSTDSTQVDNENANRLKDQIVIDYTNIEKRFKNLGQDFKQIKNCVSGKKWINQMEKVSDSCVMQGKHTGNRRKELEDAFNVDENSEALNVMFQFLQQNPEFVEFYNSYAKGVSSSVDFSGC